MTTIAVLGARGRLSSAVAQAFHASGYSVIAVTRDGRADHLPAEIERRAANALDRAALIAATRGADIIFNGLSPLYTDWESKVLPMAENVVAAAAEHGATHLFAGTVYNYGREIPAVADESTPFHRSTRKAALRIDMEACFERAAREAGVQTLSLRAGDFYGGTQPGAWFDLVIASKLAKGVVIYPGPMDLPHAWAYLPDLAEAFVELAARRHEIGTFECFNFEGHAMTGHELIAHIEAAEGRPLKRAGMPWILIRAGGIFKPLWREIGIMSYLWFAPHALAGRKFDALVGTQNRTPVREAVARAIRDLPQGHRAAA